MKILYLLMLIFVMNTSVAKNLILSKGQGGDTAGAKLVVNKLLNTENIIIENNLADIDFAKYDNILLCGQGVINDFIKLNKSVYNNINISFYSHIYDDNIINFLLKQKIANLTLFVTDSQKNKLKNINAKIISSIRPLRTIDKDYKYNKITKILNNDLIIFLGGQYKNSHNESIDVNEEDIEKTLLKIKNNHSHTKSVAFVVHPRFTNNINKINLIKSLFKNKKIEFYLPKTNFDNIIKEYPKISFIDSYNDIVETLAHSKSGKNKIYGTVDQYNLFTDLCDTMPISFHEEDSDQKDYIDSLLNYHDCGSLTESIISFFSSHKKSNKYYY